MSKFTGALFVFVISALGIAGAIGGFNYYVDPMCYYHCPDVDLSKATQNVYYQSAQVAVANPDADILVLGSSRGETTPPLWIEEVTGKKTVNLSQAGGDLLLKIAVLNAALDAGAKVKTVIWIADYFELVRSATDIKVRITPALQKHILGDGKESRWSFITSHLQRLIDHNSLEASMEHLKNSPDSHFKKAGNGSQIDYKACQSPDFHGETLPELMPKKIFTSYNNFAPRLALEQDAKYKELFEKQIRTLEQKGIKVLLLIPPFHPDFTDRLGSEFPLTKTEHPKWVEYLKSLSSSKVRVLDYYRGIPGDDKGPSFWNDGVHMTCKSVILMLKDVLNRNE